MMIEQVALIFLSCIFALTHSYPSIVDDKKWNGNWFPAAPDEQDTNLDVDENHLKTLNDRKHGVKMGIPSFLCDDAKTNLTLDWNGSPEAYTCFIPRHEYLSNAYVNPLSSCDHIPENYVAMHVCMNSSLEYSDQIPTYGTHRPLWARYGEYRYLPIQRWLHNLEHGAVVMLYHPCADAYEVQKLKDLVRKCLFRHVITPYNGLEQNRPLAVLTWGCRMTLSKVDSDVVTSFIKTHALKGAEKIFRDGQYSEELLSPAVYVTDEKDSEICPNISV